MAPLWKYGGVNQTNKFSSIIRGDLIFKFFKQTEISKKLNKLFRHKINSQEILAHINLPSKGEQA